MQIEAFSLCDAATADNGKLNILGTFDSIWLTKIPFIIPQCAIALRVRFQRIERGEHQVTVNFVDADGKNIIPPAQGSINVNFSEEQDSGAANLILNIQGLKIDKFGEYSIDLAIHGEQKMSLPLFIKERKT